MTLKIFQKGFSYSQDGDGNRLVFHLQGCNMRCKWCSNPEGLPISGVIIADSDWLEPSLCPIGAIVGKTLNRKICETCREKPCVSGHKRKGLRLSYEKIETAVLLQETLDASPLFYDGGGVTFTGGEPTLQFDALRESLTLLKEKGIHTAIETNGTHERLAELFPLLDLVILDCKQCNDEKHLAATGISNRMILENIRAAAAHHPRVHIRIPLIGTVNDSMEDFLAFIKFFSSLERANTTFEILKYHEFGTIKWRQCGYEYKQKDGFVADLSVVTFRQMLQDAGLNYHTT